MTRWQLLPANFSRNSSATSGESHSGHLPARYVYKEEDRSISQPKNIYSKNDYIALYPTNEISSVMVRMNETVMASYIPGATVILSESI